MAYDFSFLKIKKKQFLHFSPFLQAFSLQLFAFHAPSPQDDLLDVQVGLNSQFAALMYRAAHIGLSTALATQGILSAEYQSINKR